MFSADLILSARLFHILESTHQELSFKQSHLQISLDSSGFRIFLALVRFVFGGETVNQSIHTSPGQSPTRLRSLQTDYIHTKSMFSYDNQLLFFSIYIIVIYPSFISCISGLTRALIVQSPLLKFCSLWDGTEKQGVLYTIKCYYLISFMTPYILIQLFQCLISVIIRHQYLRNVFTLVLIIDTRTFL